MAIARKNKDLVFSIIVQNSPKRKAVLKNFEDTLIDSDGAIPLSTMIEIDRMRKDGIQFGVCSGKILKTILNNIKMIINL